MEIVKSVLSATGLGVGSIPNSPSVRNHLILNPK